MTYCYTPIDGPMFFYENSECGVVKHDFKLKSGDLKSAETGSVDSIISAVLIQLNTNQLHKNKEGWWGDEFLGFNIGSQLYRLKDSPASDRAVVADSMIREALEPLIKQDLIDDFKVVVSLVMGGIEAEIDIIKDGKTIFRVMR